MTREFEIISEATEDYIQKAGVQKHDDLKLINTLTNIIINEKDKHRNFEYTKKYDFKKIDKIVTEFLLYLNPYYKDYYELRKEDGSIIFDDSKEAYYEGAYSEYDDINNKRIIYVPIRGTLEDAFSIIHELFHDINVDEKQESIARMFYTEAISFLGELLLEDYLVENKIKDAKIPINYSLYCVKSKAIETSFNINLILEYLEDNYIDTNKIVDIIGKYPTNYSKDLSETIYKIVYQEELTLDNEQPYMIGALIATYMYDRIKNNKNNIMELFELNKELKNYEFEQVLDYLELEYNATDLTNESYNELQKCYKKYIKNR